MTTPDEPDAVLSHFRHDLRTPVNAILEYAGDVALRPITNASANPMAPAFSSSRGLSSVSVMAPPLLGVGT